MVAADNPTLRSDIRSDTAQQVWGKVSEADGLVLVDGSNGPRIVTAEHWASLSTMTSHDPLNFPLATGLMSHAQLRADLGASLEEPPRIYCPIHQHYKWCQHNGGIMGDHGYEAPSGF